MKPAVTPTFFNPMDPDFIRNPYPYYAALREQDPVHMTAHGYWVVTRYKDVAPLLKDVRLSNRPAPFALVNARNRERYLAAEVANGIIPFLDPPEHTRPRQLIAAVLADFLRGKEALITTVADEVLDQLDRKREGELVADFCRPFAFRCISRLVGYDEADMDRIVRWANLFLYLFHAIPSLEILGEVNTALTEFRAHTRGIAELRRADPRDDLISRLVLAERDGYRLSLDEAVDNIMLIVADGIENVATGLGTTIMMLLQHESQLTQIIAEPSLVWKGVEESLRFMTPAQYQGRIAAENIEVGGKVIRAHSIVLLALASANRDPEALDDPDSFNIHRPAFRHVSFGLGRHACIGGSLVTLEFQTALARLFDGSRHLQLLDGEVKWIARAGHRWPAEIRIALNRSAKGGRSGLVPPSMGCPHNRPTT